VAELRLISDYIGREVTVPQAKTAIDQAETFIGTIQREFSKEIDNSRSYITLVGLFLRFPAAHTISARQGC